MRLLWWLGLLLAAHDVNGQVSALSREDARVERSQRRSATVTPPRASRPRAHAAVATAVVACLTHRRANCGSLNVAPHAGCCLMVCLSRSLCASALVARVAGGAAAALDRRPQQSVAVNRWNQLIAAIDQGEDMIDIVGDFLIYAEVVVPSRRSITVLSQQGEGIAPVLSGRGASRHFRVRPNSTLALERLTLVDGTAGVGSESDDPDAASDSD